MTPPAVAPDTGVRMTGLAKSFGAVRAVRGIDISIASGETVALLGPNGAGKSTTLDMVLGLAPPDSGEVTVFGLPPAEAVRNGAIGGMLQTGELIRELSVRELVTMMASLYPKPLDVTEVLELSGIAEVADRRTHKLSGGQTQRVRLAIALVANPDLLVLDEPTVALDAEARLTFWTTMRAFAARGKTVIFATHYLEEADAYADRIVLLARGRVVADGPATEIKARVGLRTIRATLPDVDLTALSVLPGVATVDPRGEAVVLSCRDSDAALRALLAAYPQARDIEVHGAGLEEAFLELTGDHDDADAPGGEPVTAQVYTRYELLRTFRNFRLILFSLAFPLLLFFLVAGPNRDAKLAGVPFPIYYMTGMVSWGTMAAMISSGARITAERAVGWNRQLRITPLTTNAYFRTKVLTAYALAGITIVVLYTSGALLGVRLSATEWLTMTGLILVGLVPFAVMGILLGHLLTVDSIGPAVGGITSLFALLGGAYGPLAQSGFMHDLVQLLPSYWIVHACDVAFGGNPWGAEGWIVVIVWTVVLLRLTAWVYRRDTERK